MKEHFKKNKYEYISVGIILVALTALLTYLLGLWNMDINIPLAYHGGDDMSLITNAKTMTEQGWNLTVDRLGAPFNASYYDFSSSVMHNVDLVILKIFAMITGSAGAATNLTYLSVFYMCAIISYFVMRELKLSHWVSICGSLVFACSPFIFMRGLGHFVLTTCYFIPLSVLLCVWIMERDDVFAFNKNFFKNPRNWLAILFTILIANNGIVYYPYFTCFMLVVTAISKWIKTKQFKHVLRALGMIGSICVFIVIAFMPVAIHILTKGYNSAAILRGGFGESEMYGLKIIQLFLPVNSHDVPIIQNMINLYKDYSPFVNENITSYIGLFGIAGFILLLGFVFVQKRNKLCDRLSFLSELNLGLVLLGTTGGFGTMVAFFFTDKIRGYNRISIFIAYVCILGFCIAIDALYKKHKKTLFVVLGAIVSLFVIWEQFPDGYRPDYETLEALYTSDAEFVAQIEDMVEEGAMIYQLPYHEYPEANSVNNMEDYHLYIGYIHSDTLHWSYGSMKGTKEDEWNQNVSKMSNVQMVQYLKDNDFKGIYIDRRAYLDEELNSLESDLQKITGEQIIISENKALSFIKFN